ncbi:unnamed protein product [Closterium sp. Naga37s-1]|nr:unnamed protein product [Closterium sp. Naga37s-1]
MDASDGESVARATHATGETTSLTKRPHSHPPSILPSFLPSFHPSSLPVSALPSCLPSSIPSSLPSSLPSSCLPSFLSSAIHKPAVIVVALFLACHVIFFLEFPVSFRLPHIAVIEEAHNEAAPSALVDDSRSSSGPSFRSSSSSTSVPITATPLVSGTPPFGGSSHGDVPVISLLGISDSCLRLFRERADNSFPDFAGNSTFADSNATKISSGSSSTAAGRSRSSAGGSAAELDACRTRLLEAFRRLALRAQQAEQVAQGAGGEQGEQGGAEKGEKEEKGEQGGQAEKGEKEEQAEQAEKAEQEGEEDKVQLTKLKSEANNTTEPPTEASISNNTEPPTKPIKDNTEPPTEADVSEQQAGSVGQVCSEDWKRGVLARAAGSSYIRAAVAANLTGVEGIEAGIDEVCAGVKEMERRLVGGGQADGCHWGAGSGADDKSGGSGGNGGSGESGGAGGDGGSGGSQENCKQWPESCWPVPGVPLSLSHVLWECRSPSHTYVSALALASRPWASLTAKWSRPPIACLAPGLAPLALASCRWASLTAKWSRGRAHHPSHARLLACHPTRALLPTLTIVERLSPSLPVPPTFLSFPPISPDPSSPPSPPTPLPPHLPRPLFPPQQSASRPRVLAHSRPHFRVSGFTDQHTTHARLYHTNLLSLYPHPSPPTPAPNPQHSPSRPRFLVFGFSGMQATHPRLYHPPFPLSSLPPFPPPPFPAQQSPSRPRLLVFGFSAVSRPRFLVLGFSGKPTTYARMDVVEAARIAHMSGRILVLSKVGDSHVSLAHPLPLCAYWDLFNLSHAAMPKANAVPSIKDSPEKSHSNASQASQSPQVLPSLPHVAWMSPDLFLLLARAAAAAASPPTNGSDTSGSNSGVAGLRSPAVGFVWVQSRHAQQAPFLHEPLSAIIGHLLPYAMGHVPLPSNTLDLRLPVRADAVQVLMQAWQDKDVVVWVKAAAGMIEFDPPTGSLALASLPYSRQLHVLATSLLGTLNKSVMAVRLQPDMIAWRVLPTFLAPHLLPCTRSRRKRRSKDKAPHFLGFLKFDSLFSPALPTNTRSPPPCRTKQKGEAEQQRSNATAGQQEGSEKPGSEQQPGLEQSGSEQPGPEQPGSENQQQVEQQFEQQLQWCVNSSVAKASVVRGWVSVGTMFVATDVLTKSRVGGEWRAGGKGEEGRGASVLDAGGSQDLILVLWQSLTSLCALMLMSS